MCTSFHVGWAAEKQQAVASVEELHQMNPNSHLVQIQATPANLPHAEEQEQSLETRNRASRRLAAALILIVGAALPAWVAGIRAHPPQTRDIHIETYRYGFSPSRIHAN